MLTWRKWVWWQQWSGVCKVQLPIAHLESHEFDAAPSNYSLGQSDGQQICVGQTAGEAGLSLPHLSAFRLEELVSRVGSPKPDGIPEASYATASKTQTSRQTQRYVKQTLFEADFPALPLFPNRGLLVICAKGAHAKQFARWGICDRSLQTLAQV